MIQHAGASLVAEQVASHALVCRQTFEDRAQQLWVTDHHCVYRCAVQQRTLRSTQKRIVPGVLALLCDVMCSANISAVI
jgi:hypothetical protein